jgi:hypothetical protein
MGYVALTMHPHGSNSSAGYKSQIEQHPPTHQKYFDRESRLVYAYRQLVAKPSRRLRCHSNGLLVGQYQYQTSLTQIVTPLASIFLYS